MVIHPAYSMMVYMETEAAVRLRRNTRGSGQHQYTAAGCGIVVRMFGSELFRRRDPSLLSQRQVSYSYHRRDWGLSWFIKKLCVSSRVSVLTGEWRRSAGGSLRYFETRTTGKIART